MSKIAVSRPAVGKNLVPQTLRPTGEAVPLSRVSLPPGFILAAQHRHPGRNADYLPDARRQRQRLVLHRRFEIALQAIPKSVLMDAAHVERTGKATRIARHEGAGNVDITRGIEILKVGPSLPASRTAGRQYP